MKATINRKELADALRAVSKFLPRMTAIQALSHLLVEAHSGIVAITATDHEAGRRVEVEADVGSEGDILAPAALAQIVGSGAGDEVTLSATDENLTVKIGRASNRLRLGNREDYPDAEPDDGDMVPLAIESWHRVQAVAKITGGQNSPAWAQGVYLEGNQVVATDSYRLAYATASEDTEHPEVIVPARAIAGLDADVSTLSIGPRSVKARTEDGAWWARLIESNFPNWTRLTEHRPDPTVAVSFTSERLAGVLGRSTHVTGNDVPLRLTIGDGEVKAWAKRSDYGEFEESFDAITKWEGKPEDLTVAFSPAYLDSMSDPVAELTLGIIDELKPASVEGDDWWHGLLNVVRI